MYKLIQLKRKNKRIKKAMQKQWLTQWCKCGGEGIHQASAKITFYASIICYVTHFCDVLIHAWFIWS